MVFHFLRLFREKPYRMLSPSKRLLKLRKGLLKIFNRMLKHEIYPNLLEFAIYRASRKNVFAPRQCEIIKMIDHATFYGD